MATEAYCPASRDHSRSFAVTVGHTLAATLRAVPHSLAALPQPLIRAITSEVFLSRWGSYLGALQFPTNF
jgi:hypothetical protein